MCVLSSVINLLVYFIIFLLLFVLIVRLLAKSNLKKVDDYYQKSWANQEKMISLLEEIRDLLNNRDL